jgi:hypothetical protein
LCRSADRVAPALYSSGQNFDLPRRWEWKYFALPPAPTQREFSQPCPLWHGQCTIYTSAHYPRVCRAYKCKLLKEVLGENTTLSKALRMIEQAKEMVHELELLLPGSLESNFRKRLVAHLEYPKASAAQEDAELEFQLQAKALLDFYEKHFGVNDLISHPLEE